MHERVDSHARLRRQLLRKELLDSWNRGLASLHEPPALAQLLICLKMVPPIRPQEGLPQKPKIGLDDERALAWNQVVDPTSTHKPVAKLWLSHAQHTLSGVHLILQDHCRPSRSRKARDESPPIKALGRILAVERERWQWRERYKYEAS